MKGKIVTVLPIILMALVTFAPLAKAYPNLQLYGYTDKLQYKPGEKGTVYFWVYNWGPDTAILKNVTIHYPWYSIIWGGNKTIDTSDAAPLGKNKNYSNTDTFTIPEDGRAIGGSISFTVYYEFGGNIYSYSDSVKINVIPSIDAPTYRTSFEDMDKLVTLFTVLVVLVIVCTIIIAATIFLSVRKPQVEWKSEEKP